MEFTREEFVLYLERNKEKVFGIRSDNCPLSGFLSERYGTHVLVGFRHCFDGQVLPTFATKFVSKVTWEYENITGLQALSVLREISAERT